MTLKKVKNDLFDYPNRYIMQLEDGFKFSIDSLLLAEYVKVNDGLKILDMCTGNAPVPLVLSTKTNSSIVGFEIQEDIVSLAEESVAINGLENQIRIINDDVKNINNYYKAETFDIITCNPPYFKTMEGGYKNKNDYLTIARHEITISLEDIFNLAFKYLKYNGVLYMVHRASRLDEIMVMASKYRVNVKEVQLIATKDITEPSIVIVKCVKNSKWGIKVKTIKCVNNLDTYQHMF